MSWISKLFNKHSKENSIPDNKWNKGYSDFEVGRKLYLNNQDEKALEFFDSAIANGFEGEVFDLRARCLQALKYDYDAVADFDKAISLSPKDCNLYFSRALSKSAIQDLEGTVADFQRAIELSKDDSKENRLYNDEARKQGHESTAALYSFHLLSAQLRLEDEKSQKQSEAMASPEMRELMQQMKSKQTQSIKRRGQ